MASVRCKLLYNSSTNKALMSWTHDVVLMSLIWKGFTCWSKTVARFARHALCLVAHNDRRGYIITVPNSIQPALIAGSCLFVSARWQELPYVVTNHRYRYPTYHLRYDDQMKTSSREVRLSWKALLNVPPSSSFKQFFPSNKLFVKGLIYMYGTLPENWGSTVDRLGWHILSWKQYDFKLTIPIDSGITKPSYSSRARTVCYPSLIDYSLQASFRLGSTSPLCRRKWDLSLLTLPFFASPKHPTLDIPQHPSFVLTTIAN